MNSMSKKNQVICNLVRKYIELDDAERSSTPEEMTKWLQENIGLEKVEIKSTSEYGFGFLPWVVIFQIENEGFIIEVTG